jgi:hypothetical protein
MSYTITTSFVEQFSSLVHHLAQQKGSRFRDASRIESGVIGKSAHFDRLDDSEPVPTSRHGDTYLANDTHDRKTAYLEDYQKGLLVDKLDKIKLMINPQSAYTQNISYSFARLYDRVFYDSLQAPYIANASAIGGVATEDNTNGLNFIKVLNAREFFDSKEVPEGERYFGYTAETMTTLLQANQLTSADYNIVKTLVEGRIAPDQTWMGFKWRRFNTAHVNYSANNTANHHLLFAWARPSMGMALGQDVQLEIDKRPDKQNAWQVYGTMSLGGVVIEPEILYALEVYKG